MTSTRDRLETRGARSRRLRIAAIVCGFLVLALGLAALSALWWLPPVLEETPQERFVTDTAIVLTPRPSPSTAPATTPPAGSRPASATVLAEAGWVVVGVGPFLPADRTVLLSPDGVLRVEAIALETPLAAEASTQPDPAALATLLAEADARTFGDGHGDSGRPDLAAEAWSYETLSSGTTVHYTQFPHGDEITLVALLDPTPAAPGDPEPTQPDTTGTDTPGTTGTAQLGTALVLLATASADSAAEYRPTVAHILATATFGASAPTPLPTSPTEPAP